MNRFPSSFSLRFHSTVIIALMLSACATKTSQDHTLKGVEAEYARYVGLVQENNSLENLSDQWSHSARDMLYGTPDNDGQPVALDNFRAVLEYPSLFANPPTETMSVSNGREGRCLMAFAKASDAGMLALHIKFIFEDGKWLHDEVYAQYLDNHATSPDQPNCQFPSPSS